MDVRIGMVLAGDGGEPHLVTGRELSPPGTTVWLMVGLELRRLSDGMALRERCRADEPLELAGLAERVLEYLYRADTGHVLHDPASFEQYEVPAWACPLLPDRPPPGQRLWAGFWRGRR